MAFSCGFYNSVNKDRIYDAVQFGEMFDGLIADGVYSTVGHAMTVAPVSDMTVRVRSGRAWFNKTWSVNTSDYPLEIPISDLLLPRIDAVVLEIDTRLETRNNRLIVVSGSPATSPSKPTLIRENGLYQYPLAWVTVRQNAREITAGDIEVQVGRDPTPFVTGIIKSADISDLYQEWGKQFDDWFDEVKDTLADGGGNALLSLAGRVSVNETNIERLQTGLSTNNQTVSDLSTKVSSLQSSVNNISVPGSATTAEINTGSINNKYMAPNAFKTWWGSTSYAMASSADITAGTSTSKYISPYYLKQAFPKLFDGDFGLQVESLPVSFTTMTQGTINEQGGIIRKYGKVILFDIFIRGSFQGGNTSVSLQNSVPIPYGDGASSVGTLTGNNYSSVVPIVVTLSGNGDSIGLNIQSSISGWINAYIVYLCR